MELCIDFIYFLISLFLYLFLYFFISLFLYFFISLFLYFFISLGTGIIVDKKKGLVLVDRGTIPHPIGDIVLIFSESVRLDGSVVFIHPTHNFSIISYDPTCLAEGSDVEEVDVMEGEQEGKKGGWGKGGLKQGEEVVFVGLWSLNGASASTVSMKTKITSLQVCWWWRFYICLIVLINLEIPPFFPFFSFLGIRSSSFRSPNVQTNKPRCHSCGTND